jgi:hypothetical protein
MNDHKISEQKAWAIFEPGDGVELFSGEDGVVLETRFGSCLPEPEYLVRYVDAVGCAQERWWGESALEPWADEEGGDGDGIIPREELHDHVDLAALPLASSLIH